MADLPLWQRGDVDRFQQSKGEVCKGRFLRFADL
jgi:hypothetical protein